MNILDGKTGILTGANGGMGVFIAEALARRGVNLFLVGFNDLGLEALSLRLRTLGVRVAALVADLRDGAARERVVATARRELGPIDLLINNAGIEYSLPYDKITAAQIEEVLFVNLHAPMLLTRLVLPEMLVRKSGHIVNISSLAGKSGPAFQEPYSASKAGLTAFTFSLRATCRGRGVSASVISPGFVETGVYARLKAQTGCSAPALLAAVGPERVAKAVIRAIQNDQPETIISRYPVRPVLLALTAWPRFGLWLIARLGVHDFFRRVVESDQTTPK